MSYTSTKKKKWGAYVGSSSFQNSTYLPKQTSAFNSTRKKILNFFFLTELRFKFL